MKRTKGKIARVITMLCAAAVLITAVPAGNTIEASTKVSSSEKTKIKKYINKYLDYYLEYGVYLDWNPKKTKFDDKRKTDMVIHTLAYSNDAFQTQYVSNESVNNKYDSYGGGVYKYSKKTKDIIKKRGKKLFGSSYKLSLAKENKYLSNYLYPKTADGKYILIDAYDTGDYGVETKYKSIIKTSDGYIVKIKMKGYLYAEKTTPTGVEITYTIKLKKKGDSFITKSIAMK